MNIAMVSLNYSILQGGNCKALPYNLMGSLICLIFQLVFTFTDSFLKKTNKPERSSNINGLIDSANPGLNPESLLSRDSASIAAASSVFFLLR